MNELHLFAGAGGGILGSELLGIRTVCAVELEPYPASVLLARQNDGILPPFPVWDDVCTFDGRPWRGLVDVVSGGFPCQDISSAGKGAGIDGERSGLWREMRRIVGEVRPRFVFVENSPMLTARGLGCVLGDLAAIGYDAEWMVLGADDVGAPHERKRMWILAVNSAAGAGHEIRNPASQGFQGGRSQKMGQSSPKPEPERPDCKIPDSNLTGLERQWSHPGKSEVPRLGNDCQQISNTPHQGDVRGDGEFSENERPGSQGNYQQRGTQANDCGEWWSAEPDVGRVAHGVAARVDRLKAIGNGQVPAVATTAFRVLLGRFQEGKEGE
ncbi:DNA cytosine methyltransferase [Akkermansia sp.]|uniref:DNA cytosine methyltransferase n=1 Tax=Akkermansia sp. TaxID=1872421 RepID=UPI0031B85097